MAKSWIETMFEDLGTAVGKLAKDYGLQKEETKKLKERMDRFERNAAQDKSGDSTNQSGG